MASVKNQATGNQVINEQVTVNVTTSNNDLVLYPATTSGEIKVKIREICYLAKSGIKDAKLAVRSIDTKHLANLYAAREDEIPALTVVASSKGYIIVDGNHRFMRAIAMGRLAFHKPQQTEEFDFAAWVASLPEMGKDESDYVHDLTIRVKCITVKSTNELLDLAFEANDKHGLPASNDMRIKHALWILDNTIRAGKQAPSWRELGNRCHCSHEGIRKAFKAREEKKALDKQAVAVAEAKATITAVEQGSTLVTPEQKESAQVALELAKKQEREKELQKLEKTAEKAVEALRVIWRSLKNEGTFEDMAVYLSSYVTQDDFKMVDGFVSVFQELTEIIPNMGDSEENSQGN